MSERPNAYRTPSEVESPKEWRSGPGPPCLGWYVGGALVGVFCGTVLQANLTFVWYRFTSHPTYTSGIYLIAAAIALVTGLLGIRGGRPLRSRWLVRPIRLVAGFVLGFFPYCIDRLLTTVVPQFGSRIAMLDPVVVIVTNIGIAVLVSIGLEWGLRRLCLRRTSSA